MREFKLMRSILDTVGKKVFVLSSSLILSAHFIFSIII